MRDVDIERKWKGFAGAERATEGNEEEIAMEKSVVKPLHSMDIAVLKAIYSLEKRGFSKIRFNDIREVTKRFGVISESELYDALQKSIDNRYIQGYKHRYGHQMRYVNFILTSQGRGVLGEYGGSRTS